MSAVSQNPTPKHRSALSAETVMVDERTAVLTLEGDLDLWSAPQLKRTLCDLIDSGCKRVVLDLGRVGFMDSTALGVLVAVDRRLAADERLALAQPRPEVLRLFELTGVAATFRIFPSPETAIGSAALDPVKARSGAAPALTTDAALLLGIAATAMPFARSPEEQAERWLRALRRHGEAGAVLASLGVHEAPVSRLELDDAASPLGASDADPVAIVTDHASHVASVRDASRMATTDVLMAVMHVYGETFDRVLAAHGVDIDELAARLATSDPNEADSQV